MNANELADELKEYALDNGYSHIDYADSMNQAATMLRQQQELIEMSFKALTVAHKFCGSLTSEVCPDTVALPINKALANLIKAQG